MPKGKHCEVDRLLNNNLSYYNCPLAFVLHILLTPKIKETYINVTLHLFAGKGKSVVNHKGRNRHFTNPEELEEELNTKENKK